MTSVSIQLGAMVEEAAPAPTPDRAGRLRARALQAACTHAELVNRSALDLAAQAAALCVVVDQQPVAP